MLRVVLLSGKIEIRQENKSILITNIFSLGVFTSPPRHSIPVRASVLSQTQYLSNLWHVLTSGHDLVNGGHSGLRGMGELFNLSVPVSLCVK